MIGGLLVHRLFDKSKPVAVLFASRKFITSDFYSDFVQGN